MIANIIKIFLIQLLLILIQQKQISTALRELVRYQHKFQEQYYTIKNRQIFKYAFQRAVNPKVEIIDSLGNKAQNSCEYFPSQINLKQIDNIKFASSFSKEFEYHNIELKALNFHQLIYVINNKMQIAAFRYTDDSLQKITEVTINTGRNIDQISQHKNLLMTINGQFYVYLFSAYGVWKIQTKSILSNIQKLDLDFNYQVYDGSHLYDMIFLAVPLHGFLTYKVTVKDSLILFDRVTHINKDEELIMPIDIAIQYQFDLIFVLGQTKNIYVYMILESKLELYDIIEFQHQSNFQIKTQGRRIYYSFMQGNAFEICQLYYDPQTKTAQLIRYYKSFDYLFDFTTAIQQLLVLSYDTLDILPNNIDPRLIQKQFNGVRKEFRAHKLSQINYQVYATSDATQLKLIKLVRKQAQINCNFKNHHESVLIKYKANLSTCAIHQPNLFNQKVTYNSYCEVQRVINIQINIPEQFQQKKLILYCVVIFVVALFVIGIICLNQWRNGRLDIIDKITDQIKRYKQKQKRIQPFIQQQQIQLPQNMISQQRQQTQQKGYKQSLQQQQKKSNQ